MVSPKYPLQPLLEHRARGVDDATASLGDSVQRREQAEAAQRRAEATRHSAKEQQASLRDDERKRLGRGELSVADLARGGAWEVGAQAALGVLARAVDVAGTKAGDLRDTEAEARDALARSMADRDVVVKDRARFDAQGKKAALAAEEEAAEEARRHPGRAARS